MSYEDEESAPQKSSGADNKKGKRKHRKKTHNHIGPHARAFRSGLAFCPVCDAEKTLRLTDKERELERLAKETQKSSRRS